MENEDPPESTSGPAPIDGDPIRTAPPEGAGRETSEIRTEPLDDALEDGLVDSGEVAGGAGEDVAEEVVAPPVVAVVVTTGGPWLDAAVASLAAQDYPALSVLVLDNASEDDPTARIATEMPNAFVRRLPENLGFAAAANDALRTVEGATFLLFCHDDVALDPDAVRVMVEEAYRSNAAIVVP